MIYIREQAEECGVGEYRPAPDELERKEATRFGVRVLKIRDVKPAFWDHQSPFCPGQTATDCCDAPDYPQRDADKRVWNVGKNRAARHKHASTNHATILTF